MAETVPLISVSTEFVDAEADSGGEIQDVSGSGTDQDAADEQRAKSIIAARIRRKHRTQKKKSKPSSNTIFVDEGEDGGLTDVETVEMEDGDEEADSSEQVASYEDLQNVLELIKPQIVEIVDDQNGKTVVTNTTRVAVVNYDKAEDLSEPSDGEERLYNLKEVLTDCEDLDGSDDDEASAKSDYDDMHHAIDMATDTGTTNTKDDEQVSSRPLLLTPSASSGRSGGRKKTRKTPRRRANAEPASQPLLSVGDDGGDPLTDVEYMSADSSHSTSASPRLLVPATDDQGSTDVEDIDDIQPMQSGGNKHLMPGIVVTGDGASDDDSRSGRSSRSDVTGRQGVTDIEDLEDDEEVGHPTPSALLLPHDDNEGLTDVEDIEVDDEDVPRPRPPNGPALHSHQSAEQQIIIIQEDENGQVTSTASSNSASGGYAPMLLVVDVQEEGGSTDVEYLGMSGDEGDEAHARSTAITPDISYMVQSDHSVQVQVVDSQNEFQAADSTTNTLGVPGQNTEMLTDTEDLELSDVDGTDNLGNRGRMFHQSR